MTTGFSLLLAMHTTGGRGISLPGPRLRPLFWAAVRSELSHPHGGILAALDWKPFDYYSVARVLPIGNQKAAGIQALTTFKLNLTDAGGTNLQIYWEVRSLLPVWAVRYIVRFILRYMKLEPAYINLSNLLTGAKQQSL